MPIHSEICQGKISLEKTASLVHLSNAAFCKFFKRVTDKTFPDYVNDIRIGHACSLLTESDKTIGAIAYECGFEVSLILTGFEKKTMTPKSFRNNVLHF